jgi:hypothetical protein
VSVFVRLLTAFAPLLLTPLLVYVLAEGWLNFGGGEKDILLTLPWILWSLVFAVTALVLWMRGWTHQGALVRAGVTGTAVVVIVFATLLTVSLLGVNL